MFLTVFPAVEANEFARTINDPIFIRLSFIVGLITLVVGLVRRDIVVADTDVPIWVVGAILLVTGPILRFVVSPETAFTTLALDLGGRVLIGVISGLIVHIIVTAVKKR